jgi:hypothetical protein
MCKTITITKRNICIHWEVGLDLSELFRWTIFVVLLGPFSLLQCLLFLTLFAPVEKNKQILTPLLEMEHTLTPVLKKILKPLMLIYFCHLPNPFKKATKIGRQSNQWSMAKIGLDSFQKVPFCTMCSIQLSFYWSPQKTESFSASADSNFTVNRAILWLFGASVPLCVFLVCVLCAFVDQ